VGDNKKERRSRNTGGGGSGTPSCADLSFTAALNSAVPTVLAKLSVGSVLQVRRHSSGVLAVVFGKEEAGAITSGRALDLLKCIESGFAYKAVVSTLQGGSCTVDISGE
jgi:hypothetical protein